MPKVLAIDDNIDNLLTLSAILKNLMPNCAVITAQSGSEGIAKAETQLPDTILLDMLMPDMDGFETCRKLKSNKTTKHIPVIMITASKTSSQIRIKGLEIGANAFLSKPIDEAELISQVQVSLRINEAEGALRKGKHFLEEKVQEQMTELTEEVAKHKLSEENLRIHQIELTAQNEELHKAQIELEAARARYFDLYDLAPVGYITVSEKGLILEGNLAAANILGLMRGTLVKQPMNQFILKEDQEIYFLHRKKLFETGGPQAYELQMVKKDGRVFWAHLETTKTQDAKGAPLYRIVLSDISELKKAERREFLAAEILNIINDGLPLADLIDRIQISIQREMKFDAVGIRLSSGNDFPYFAQSGFSSDFLLTENTLTVRTPDDGLCRDENGNVSLECTCGLVISGKTDPTNTSFTQAGSFWTNDSSQLLKLPSDRDPRLHPRNRCIHEAFQSVALIPICVHQKIVGLLQLNDRKKDCFTLDMIRYFEGLAASISIALTRLQAEATLKERTSQLEAVNKELESFSYSVSHDLRAPLRAINGFSRMLARDLQGKLDKESMHRLDTIQENGLKMNQLIDDVLAFSRLSQESLTMKVIDMGDLTADVWNELQGNNSQRKISFEVHPIACYGDTKMIRRVLTNLLSNAIKFSQEREIAQIEVGGYENEHECVYYVKDNGSGFDMQYAGKLFTLFQRLHSDRDYEGTGAGLSIVKRIIERHGGRVWADSKVNGGATFYFSLPKSLS